MQQIRELRYMTKTSPALLLLLAAHIQAGSPIRIRLVLGVACLMPHKVDGAFGGILIANAQGVGKMLA